MSVSDRITTGKSPIPANASTPKTAADIIRASTSSDVEVARLERTLALLQDTSPAENLTPAPPRVWEHVCQVLDASGPDPIASPKPAPVQQSIPTTIKDTPPTASIQNTPWWIVAVVALIIGLVIGLVIGIML